MSTDRDVAIVGGGLSGMATALMLQARGLSTVVLESHSRLGGCAGFYPRNGFSFDVGATTLVDFDPGGQGGQFLDEIGLADMKLELLPGYLGWLPDRTVNIARDPSTWQRERLAQFGSSKAHQDFWKLLDALATTYWRSVRQGVRLPIRSAQDLLHNARTLSTDSIRYARYLRWSMGDALVHFGLRDDHALTGLLSMMVEDTVHAKLDDAPLINAALGISIRGAGLARPQGGMRGFWRQLTARYVALGGKIRLRTAVQRVSGRHGNFTVESERISVSAAQVVCAIPIQNAISIAPDCFGADAKALSARDEPNLGGGLVLCLGVPESEVNGAGLGHRHHQLLQDYKRPLGNGNNMFVSVSAPGDTLSAPKGYRAVMISTHCELAPWHALKPDQYSDAKAAAADQLLKYARRVYPNLGEGARVMEIGTPLSYARFTRRFHGAVGGTRLNLRNANQNAVPRDIGQRGCWMTGDSIWPGLGTVACVLSARHVANDVQVNARKTQPRLISRARAYRGLLRV